jgi:LPS-assembly protein
MNTIYAGVANRALTGPGCGYGKAVRLTIIFLLAGYLLAGSHAFGQGIDGGVDRLLKDDPKQPWQITADEIGYDDRDGRYVAKGNVNITKGDRRLTADVVRFNQQTMVAEATGHVVLVAGGDMLIGERIEIDLENQTGTITEGTIFLHENHFYIRGAKIEKLGEREYAIEKASLSSCEGERPSWKITGRKLNIEVEGQGVVKHAALWAKDVPVLYTPYLSFPATTRRKSGFLMPEFGASDRKGKRFITPFFWAINDQSDMTLYHDYMEERGHKLGAEYRYLVDPLTKGTAMYDYLNDDKIDDGQGDNSKEFGYPDDDFLRRNQTRYWFRMKHDQGLPFGFRGRLDLDLVSDQDYLTEFRDGLTGFDETRNYYRNEFGRDLDDYNDQVRTNQGVLNKNWYHSALNGGIIWLDDTTKQRKDGEPSVDTSLQRLPFILWDAVKQPAGPTPFLMSADTEWTYFYSDDNSKGLRFDVNPRVYLPFSLGDYLYVEPSAGIRQTAWFIDRYQELGEDGQERLEERLGRNLEEEKQKSKDQFRTLYDLKLDVSTEASGVYDIGGTTMDAIRHTLRPRVVYEYIPYDDQDKYPAFINQTTDGEPIPLNDRVNRIAAQNLITYSLVNTLTSRYRNAPTGDTEAEENFGYNDFLRLEIRQSYNIRTARSDKRDRPFSPILTELELNPRKYLKLKTEVAYDTYDERFVKRDVNATLKSPRGDKLTIDYRYDKREVDFTRNETLNLNINSITTGATIKLPYHFTAYGSTEYNLEDERRRIESQVGLTYQAPCWSLDVNYTDTENSDKAIAFRITLKGLGGYGYSQKVGVEDEEE